MGGVSPTLKGKCGMVNQKVGSFLELQLDIFGGSSALEQMPAVARGPFRSLRERKSGPKRAVAAFEGLKTITPLQ